MKTILISVALGVLSAAASAQSNSAYSVPGVCSASGGFHCDSLTIAELDGRVLLQFSENGGHTDSFYGYPESADSTLISGNEYLDGSPLFGGPVQCRLIYKDGELLRVHCPALTFKTTKGTE